MKDRVKNKAINIHKVKIPCVLKSDSTNNPEKIKTINKIIEAHKTHNFENFANASKSIFLLKS